MPRDAVPIVYCETNWIVALAFEHHEHHQKAQQLLKQAEGGECSLRLPHAALLEAHRPIDDEARRVLHYSRQLSIDLTTAFQNGFSDFSDADKLKELSAIVSRYIGRPLHDVVSRIAQSQALVVLHNREAAIKMLDQIRPELRFRGVDDMDMFLLASIIANRETEDPQRPALFFSANHKEFEAKDTPSAKVPVGFYERHRLYWTRDFDLRTAAKRWSASFMAPAPSSPTMDTSSTGAMTTAFHECLSSPSLFDPRQVARLKALFHDGAKIVFSSKDAAPRLLNVDQFIKEARKIFGGHEIREVGFDEVSKPGLVVERICSFEVAPIGTDGDAHAQRGKSVLHFCRSGDRWTLVGVFWGAHELDGAAGP